MLQKTTAMNCLFCKQSIKEGNRSCFPFVTNTFPPTVLLINLLVCSRKDPPVYFDNFIFLFKNQAYNSFTRVSYFKKKRLFASFVSLFLHQPFLFLYLPISFSHTRCAFFFPIPYTF